MLEPEQTRRFPVTAQDRAGNLTQVDEAIVLPPPPPVDSVKAEPVIDPTSGPAVRISWKPSVFAQANQDRILYHIYREPADPTRPRVPVLTARSNESSVVDTQTARTVSYVDIPPGQEVDTPDLTDEGDIPGVTAG